MAILRRVDRIESGNFGDHKSLREGVSELRLDVGPGYCVYFAMDGKAVVFLLCGGDKGSQDRDIERAVRAWLDYLKRSK